VHRSSDFAIRGVESAVVLDREWRTVVLGLVAPG
jgi:hypothetical protein